MDKKKTNEIIEYCEKNKMIKSKKKKVMSK